MITTQKKKGFAFLALYLFHPLTMYLASFFSCTQFEGIIKSEDYSHDLFFTIARRQANIFLLFCDYPYFTHPICLSCSLHKSNREATKSIAFICLLLASRSTNRRFLCSHSLNNIACNNYPKKWRNKKYWKKIFLNTSTKRIVKIIRY